MSYDCFYRKWVHNKTTGMIEVDCNYESNNKDNNCLNFKLIKQSRVGKLIRMIFNIKWRHPIKTPKIKYCKDCKYWLLRDDSPY